MKKMKLTEESKKEMLDLAQSASLKEDMRTLKKNRRNPFFRNGEPDVDAYTEFVARFNEFINHTPKPFRRIIDRNMKL